MADARAARRITRARGSLHQRRHVSAIRLSVKTPSAEAKAPGLWRYGAVNLASSAWRGLRRPAVKGRTSDQAGVAGPSAQALDDEIAREGHSVAKRAEATRPARGGERAEGNFPDRIARRRRTHEHLCLEHEAASTGRHALEKLARVDAEARLRVRDVLAGQPVDEEARHSEGVQSRRLHEAAAAAQAASDHEGVGLGLGRREQSRDIVGIVLAIAVERDHALRRAGKSAGEAQAEGRALAQSPARPEDDGAGGGGRLVASVPRPVVHHDDGAVEGRPLDESSDGGRLVEDGNDGDVIAHAARPIRSAVRQPPRARP